MSSQVFDAIKIIQFRMAYKTYMEQCNKYENKPRFHYGYRHSRSGNPIFYLNYTQASGSADIKGRAVRCLRADLDNLFRLPEVSHG